MIIFPLVCLFHPLLSSCSSPKAEEQLFVVWQQQQQHCNAAAIAMQWPISNEMGSRWQELVGEQ